MGSAWRSASRADAHAIAIAVITVVIVVVDDGRGRNARRRRSAATRVGGDRAERYAVVERQAGSLVDRLFGGRISPLVAQLAEQRDIAPKDLEELEALVRRLRK